MKKILSPLFGRGPLLGLATLAVAGFSAPAATILTDQHTDIDVGYDDANGEWELLVHNETDDIEYDPANVLLAVLSGAQTTVQPGQNFLGNVGDPVWILPQIQNPGLLFLGTSGEEIASGIFLGDAVILSFRGLTGPGQFAMYSDDGLGSYTVFFDSRDGFANDMVSIAAGGHSDYNWAFSAPGDYTVTLQASGVLLDGERTSSEAVDYHFRVVPEPASAGLLGLGAAVWLWSRRRV